jgi:polar amino acid transport system substrate-binding protein
MKKLIKSISVCLVILFSISSVNAATLTDRLKDGHKLRLGFGTAVPWAYAGDNGEALGFVNMIALTWCIWRCNVSSKRKSKKY